MTWKHERYAKLLSAKMGISPSEKLVLQAIAYACFEVTDGAHISNSRLSKTTGISNVTVSRCVNSLIKAGLLSRTSAKGKAPFYHFPLPPDFDADATDQEISARLDEGPHNLSPQDRLRISADAAARAMGYESHDDYVRDCARALLNIDEDQYE